MEEKVFKAVSKAREVFEIEGFPGDFFTYIEKGSYSSDDSLILFREDIDKLSGFIGYGEKGITAICINYNRSIGHQNFTLAHEIGHWIMHKGKNISDNAESIWKSDDKIEKEASEFASELLYPERYLDNDFDIAMQNGLFIKENRKILGKYVDELCHKYYISFEVVLRKLLFKKKQAKQYSEIRREIEKALGCTISKAFDKDFYMPNDRLLEYQKYMKPYEKLETKVNILIDNKKIGKATGESIILRNGVRDN